MKKISLKTFRKSFNLSKSKEDTDFMVVPQPALAGDFGKDEPLFGGCYGKELAGCDLGGDDEKGGKGRSKSESLMGTLKRRLSAKQKQKGKGGAAAGGRGRRRHLLLLVGAAGLQGRARAAAHPLHVAPQPPLQPHAVAPAAHQLGGDVHQDGGEGQGLGSHVQSEPGPERGCGRIFTTCSRRPCARSRAAPSRAPRPSTGTCTCTSRNTCLSLSDLCLRTTFSTPCL